MEKVIRQELYRAKSISAIPEFSPPQPADILSQDIPFVLSMERICGLLFLEGNEVRVNQHGHSVYDHIQHPIIEYPSTTSPERSTPHLQFTFMATVTLEFYTKRRQVCTYQRK